MKRKRSGWSTQFVNWASQATGKPATFMDEELVAMRKDYLELAKEGPGLPEAWKTGCGRTRTIKGSSIP